MNRLRGRLRLLLPALSQKNYRLYFFGQGASRIGTSMQQLAMAWLVYRLSGSAWLLGVVAFCTQAPIFLLVPVAGVISDRCDRRTILFVTQAVAMLQSLALAVLTLGGWVTQYHVIALGILLGVVDAFDKTTRHALMADIVVDRRQLANAFGLNASLTHVSRLVGPALAGVMISVGGEGLCFLVNAFSYGALIIALQGMRWEGRASSGAKNHLWADFRDGARYVAKTAAIRNTLLLVGMFSLVGLSFVVLLPVIAAQTLHGGARTLSSLSSIAGIGSFLGCLYVLLWARSSTLAKRQFPALVLAGTGLMVFALSKLIGFALIVLCCTEFFVSLYMVSSNISLQLFSDEDKRGRVTSFYTMFSAGMVPLGSLLAGYCAERIGAPATVFMAGSLCVAGSLLVAGHRIPSEPHPVQNSL